MTDENEKEVKESKASKKEREGTVNLSAADIVNLVNTIVTKSEERSNQSTRELVDALLESRKPYISPEQIENDKALKESFKVLEQRKRDGEKSRQNSCPHFQGSNELSEETGDRASIIWHHLDTGTWFGICTNCQRQFWPGDADYQTSWARKSGNKRSEAGQRQFFDPVAAQKAGR